MEPDISLQNDLLFLEECKSAGKDLSVTDAIYCKKLSKRKYLAARTEADKTTFMDFWKYFDSLAAEAVGT